MDIFPAKHLPHDGTDVSDPPITSKETTGMDSNHHTDFDILDQLVYLYENENDSDLTLTTDKSNNTVEVPLKEPFVTDVVDTSSSTDVPEIADNNFNNVDESCLDNQSNDNLKNGFMETADSCDLEENKNSTIETDVVDNDITTIETASTKDSEICTVNNDVKRKQTFDESDKSTKKTRTGSSDKHTKGHKTKPSSDIVKTTSKKTNTHSRSHKERKYDSDKKKKHESNIKDTQSTSNVRKERTYPLDQKNNKSAESSKKSIKPNKTKPEKPTRIGKSKSHKNDKKPSQKKFSKSISKKDNDVSLLKKYLETITGKLENEKERNIFKKIYNDVLNQKITGNHVSNETVNIIINKIKYRYALNRSGSSRSKHYLEKYVRSVQKTPAPLQKFASFSDINKTDKNSLKVAVIKESLSTNNNVQLKKAIAACNSLFDNTDGDINRTIFPKMEQYSLKKNVSGRKNKEKFDVYYVFKDLIKLYQDNTGGGDDNFDELEEKHIIPITRCSRFQKVSHLLLFIYEYNKLTKTICKNKYISLADTVKLCRGVIPVQMVVNYCFCFLLNNREKLSNNSNVKQEKNNLLCQIRLSESSMFLLSSTLMLFLWKLLKTLIVTAKNKNSINLQDMKTLLLVYDIMTDKNGFEKKYSKTEMEFMSNISLKKSNKKILKRCILYFIWNELEKKDVNIHSLISTLSSNAEEDQATRSLFQVNLKSNLYQIVYLLLISICYSVTETLYDYLISKQLVPTDKDAIVTINSETFSRILLSPNVSCKLPYNCQSSLKLSTAYFGLYNISNSLDADKSSIINGKLTEIIVKHLSHDVSKPLGLFKEFMLNSNKLMSNDECSDTSLLFQKNDLYNILIKVLDVES